MNWPRDLDYICSSYGQYYDEIFKLFAAKEISKKAKLFLFQHGYGGIFADKDLYNIYIDSKISDKYFSWGNNKKLKYENFFIPKIISLIINSLVKKIISFYFFYMVLEKIL